MKNLTPAQKIYLGVLLGLVGAWLGLELGAVLYEYGHGQNALTALLLQLAAIMKFGILGVAALAWVLQRTGILPTPQAADPALARSAGPMNRLRTLALWIVIALLLVFLFNLFQGSRGHAPRTGDPTTILIEWFPLLLVVVVWVYFLLRFQARKNRDLSGKN
jgi:hypothetical protein